MGGALRKTMLYLGLADDQGESEEYLDEYEELEAPVRDRDDYQNSYTPAPEPVGCTSHKKKKPDARPNGLLSGQASNLLSLLAREKARGC